MKTWFYLFIFFFLYFRPNLCSVQRENYRRGRRLYTQWRYTRLTSSTVGPRAFWPCSQVQLIIRSSGWLTFPTPHKQNRWDGKFKLDILNCPWKNDVAYFHLQLLGAFRQSLETSLEHIYIAISVIFFTWWQVYCVVNLSWNHWAFVITVKRAVFNTHIQST